MKIISHRGVWQVPEEKNTWTAFERSFSLGFGTETDFRDCGGELVISHDPARLGAIKAADFLGLVARHNRALPLAINIKSDGLQSMLKTALAESGISNYFLFDMSIPDTIQSLKAGLPVFTRHSDVERQCTLYDEATGVWMDAFYDDSWLTPAAISAHLEAGKHVCIVSPELHRRPHMEFWQRLKDSPVNVAPLVTLCTDLPEEAVRYFQYD